MRKNLLSLAAALALAGCTRENEMHNALGVRVDSPDGRNVIVLTSNPLSISIYRDDCSMNGVWSEIGMTINGKQLSVADFSPTSGVCIVRLKRSGIEDSPVYKKGSIDLTANEAFVDAGDWGVRLVARDDGVAYRFETKMPGEIVVNDEKAKLVACDTASPCWGNYTSQVGCEETVPESQVVGDFATDDKDRKLIYLPLAYAPDMHKTIAVTESDVRDYPILNYTKTMKQMSFRGTFDRAPRKTVRDAGHFGGLVEKGGRWVRVTEREDYLVKTSGTRTFPWRTFVLADSPVQLVESDIVRALAPAPDAGADFSWVKPGKVAWDWWNCFDNKGDPEGCTTETYRRFIDFAAKSGVEYVILDEGWSAKLDIWQFSPAVDVPALIDYANSKGVGIILWMAWPQVYGDEERVVSHFAKLGAKGFKIDFLDRGDAEIANFLEKFAAVCAKHKMLVDYHGVYRPTGLQRRYPNVVNYEGIHGLEQLKWFPGGEKAERELLFSDVAAAFLRMTAGPMDYTPGAMLNHAVGTGYRGAGRKNPGSVGTRCRQMAMMALYEAPLQMLCDSPTNYERNEECFAFMSKVPVVWEKTVGLDGTPDTMISIARQAKDGSWYAAGLTTYDGRDYELNTEFLGEGTWTAEIFRDGADADKVGTRYVHETKSIAAGEKIALHMAPGGGFVVRFSK